jgi:hypothetical protein
VAVATQQEGFTTLTGLIPGLIFHAASLFAGIVFFGLGMRTAARSFGSRATAEGGK